MSTQFMVRVVDSVGRAQYLATCGEAPPVGFDGTQFYVDVDTTSTPPIYKDAPQAIGGLDQQCLGQVLVNPVVLVRWEIMNYTQEPAQYVMGLDGLNTNPNTPDPNKYDLMRSYVDAFGNAVPETTELVAEYAVDFDVAFSVDQGDTTGYNPTLVTFPFDDPRSATWAYDVSAQAISTTGPQRIRSVRFRLVTRTSLPDRTVNIPVANYGGQEFMYRYCVVPPCGTSDDVLRWARTRTVTTEVSLPNQQKDFF
jgi:hypothetical protein